MKKIVCIALALLLAFALCACGQPAQNPGNTQDAGNTQNAGNSQNAGNTQDTGNTQNTGDEQNAGNTEPSGAASAGSDMEYIKSKGTLVVGITEFEPMDYQDADGNWIGFDADMATAFAESLGVNVEFQIIDWDNKVMELNGKTIDVVWNGMTLTNDVLAAMECSDPYFLNAQVVVVKADAADQYQTVESLAGLAFAVESGSAGKEQADENGFAYTEVADQATALMEVASGTSDAAIIDISMANAMIGEGTSYADLTYTVSLNSEEYGVGFRKGSDLAEALNQFFVDCYLEGTVQAVADAYGILGNLIAGGAAAAG